MTGSLDADLLDGDAEAGILGIEADAFELAAVDVDKININLGSGGLKGCTEGIEIRGVLAIDPDDDIAELHALVAGCPFAKLLDLHAVRGILFRIRGRIFFKMVRGEIVAQGVDGRAA